MPKGILLAAIAAAVLAVAVLTFVTSSNIGRLTYGEIRRGTYEALWDSPLFEALFLSWDFRDVDNDGTQETLVRSQALRSYTMLSIFDIRGRELTRIDEDCMDSPGFRLDGGACPIGGETVDFAAQNGRRPLDIIASGSVTGTGPSLRTFRFSNGRYRQVRARSESP